jgi:hypothetical protein
VKREAGGGSHEPRAANEGQRIEAAVRQFNGTLERSNRRTVEPCTVELSTHGHKFDDVFGGRMTPAYVQAAQKGQQAAVSGQRSAETALYLITFCRKLPSDF